MGFFSWECKHCSKEILAPYPPSKWSEAVALFNHGGMVMGMYDGYGCIEGTNVGDGDAIYHKHCWEIAGKPMSREEAGGSSDYAPGQGYFLGAKELIENYPIEGGWTFSESCPNKCNYGWIKTYDLENPDKCPVCNGTGFISLTEDEIKGNPDYDEGR